MSSDKDLVLFSINIGGTRSTVSMDGRMVHYLQLKMGGMENVRLWVKETVVRLEQEWNEKASGNALGQRVRANTGLSRAIQRESLDELMRDVCFNQQGMKENEQQAIQ